MKIFLVHTHAASAPVTPAVIAARNPKDAVELLAKRLGALGHTLFVAKVEGFEQPKGRGIYENNENHVFRVAEGKAIAS